MTVLIVGAGPAGLALALGLRRGGAAVTLVERRSFEQLFADAGGAYELTARSLEILEELGVSLAGRSTTLTRFEVVDGRERALTRLELHAAGVPIVSVTRAELQRALWASLEPLGVSLITEASPVSIVQAADGVRVDVGVRTEVADAVIGADGVHSEVRRLCFGGSGARDTGFAAWWGRSSREALPLEVGHSFGVLVPGRSFVATPSAAGDELLWTVCERNEETPTRPGVGGLPPNVVRAVENAHTVAKTRLLEQRPLLNWVDRRVCLIGDAAHGMTPFLGLGANSALEDAQLVATALLEGVPLDEALRSRPKTLNPRISEARRLGLMMHVRSPVFHWLFRLVTWLVPRALVLRQLRARHARPAHRPTAAREVEVR